MKFTLRSFKMIPEMFLTSPVNPKAYLTWRRQNSWLTLALVLRLTFRMLIGMKLTLSVRARSLCSCLLSWCYSEYVEWVWTACGHEEHRCQVQGRLCESYMYMQWEPQYGGRKLSTKLSFVVFTNSAVFPYFIQLAFDRRYAPIFASQIEPSK